MMYKTTTKKVNIKKALLFFTIPFVVTVIGIYYTVHYHGYFNKDSNPGKRYDFIGQLKKKTNYQSSKSDGNCEPSSRIKVEHLCSGKTEMFHFSATTIMIEYTADSIDYVSVYDNLIRIGLPKFLLKLDYNIKNVKVNHIDKIIIPHNNKKVSSIFYHLRIDVTVEEYFYVLGIGSKKDFDLSYSLITNPINVSTLASNRDGHFSVRSMTYHK